jgi:hypothetical protein
MPDDIEALLDKPKKKPLKVNISLNPETMEMMTEFRDELGVEMGFTPTYSQVIQYLIKKEKSNEGNA